MSAVMSWLVLVLWVTAVASPGTIELVKNHEPLRLERVFAWLVAGLSKGENQCLFLSIFVDLYCF